LTKAYLTDAKISDITRDTFYSLLVYLPRHYVPSCPVVSFLGILIRRAGGVDESITHMLRGHQIILGGF